MAAALAIVPLTAAVALKLTGSTRTALIAASLAAFNPYLLYWGPQIRAYSLLIALTLLTINEFFHWYWRRNCWSGVRCAAAVLLLLLAHLNGIYTVVFLVLLLIAESVSAGFSSGRRFLWQARTLLIPLAGVAIAVAIAYWRILPDIVKVNGEWGTDIPPTSMGYVPRVFATYMGAGYAAWVSLLLLLAGCWSAVREKRALLLLCAVIILTPLLMSLQGVSVHTAAFARYLIFSLPLLLILMAEGVDWIARHVWIRRAAVVAWSLTALMLLCWTPQVQGQFLFKKQWPYALVAKFLHQEMEKDDVIVAGWGIGFTLGQFFHHPNNSIMMPNTYVRKIGTRLDARAPGRIFYVTSPAILNGRKAHIQRFGGLEVTTFSDNTARGLLEDWRQDLLARTAGRVYAPFEGDYQLLALLEERLPSGQSADHWRSLAERCRAQSPGARDVPGHLKKAAQAVMFP